MNQENEKTAERASRREFLLRTGQTVTGAALVGAVVPPVYAASNETMTALSSLSSLEVKEWGNLAGQFLYTGDPPVRKLIKITKDIEYCSKGKLREENLIVDAKTKGVANVIVWLYIAPRKPMPPLHPSYAKSEKATVPIDSDQCHIVPHVTLLRTTQTLMMRNTDPIGDGIKINTFRNSPVNLTFAPDSEVPHHFPNAERLPAAVGCPIHPWESGWLLVLPHPYMAVSDAQGRFEIKNIPAGKWAFQFWHEKAGYLDKVTVAGKPKSWRRGRVEIDVHAGTNDLGTIELAPHVFKE